MVDEYLFAAFALIFSLFYYYWDKALFNKTLTHVKKASGSVPFLGHYPVAQMNFHRIHDFFHELDVKAKYGIWQLNLPFFPATIQFGDPKILEHVTKTNFENYVKGPLFYKNFSDSFGNGIFTIDGDEWKFQRKIGANIFTIKNFKKFVEQIFRDEMVTFNQVLDQLASSGTECDLHELFHRFTMDAFVYIAFGVKLNCLTEKEIPFTDAFDIVNQVVANRFFDPAHFLKERLFKIGKDHRDSVKILYEFGMKLINAKRETSMHSEEKMDLIGLFMNVKDEDGNPCFSDDVLIDIALAFISAGRETTAQALSWTIYCLAKNPKAQEKALEEINQVLGDADMPTYEQVKNLAYVKACFFETLRLYPSAPRNTKMAVEDDILPDGTFVPQGTYVGWSYYSMGRNPLIWGSDAEEYRPERWLEMETQPSPFEYPVFHAGPRSCLGRNMAELEGTFILACFLKRYKFEASDIDSVTYDNSITLPMKNGFKGKIVKLA